jgi:hypothetical protein
MPAQGVVTSMTALFVSTSIRSASAGTESPSLNKTRTMVASAMDSPSWGMRMGASAMSLDI